MNKIISKINTVFQKYVRKDSLFTLVFSIVALAHTGTDGRKGH